MKLITMLTFLTFSVITLAAESKPAATPSSYPTVEDVRCEKLNGHSLSEFKAKLVENCDLNKPFSSSMSKLLNEESYFYCCQLKK
jgi:hypothetical protein